jgi:hypothetical protein
MSLLSISYLSLPIKASLANNRLLSNVESLYLATLTLIFSLKESYSYQKSSVISGERSVKVSSSPSLVCNFSVTPTGFKIFRVLLYFLASSFTIFAQELQDQLQV